MKRISLRSLSRARVVVPVIVLALLVLHVANGIRIDASALSGAIGPLMERSRALAARARPEYQDYALATLPPSQVNGPSYRFDDYLWQAKASRVPALDATADNAILYSFEMEESASNALVAPNEDVELRLDHGILALSGHAGAGYVTNSKPIRVPRKDIGDIVIRARATKDTRLTLGWSKEANAANPFKNQIDIGLEASDDFQTLVINAGDVLRRGLKPEDPVAHIYIRPSAVADADLEIDYIRFVSKIALFLSAVNGVVHEEVGGELRPALYMLTDQSLSWTIDVPTAAPRMDFGQAILSDDVPVRFRVTIEHDGKSTRAHEANIEDASQWYDVSVDLQAWAGKTVTASLHVAAPTPKTVAFWASPRIRSAPKRRLNVIIVLEDALRADYLSLYGYERDTSPNKSRLAAQRGIVFEHAFAQAEKTRPSIPALFTGLYPTATGVWHFSDVLSDRYLTLAEIMRSQGFVTASFIQNGNAGAYAGLHQGFDTLGERKLVGKSTASLFGEPTFNWIRKHRDENFLLYLHAIEPHGPYEPQPPFGRWYLESKGQGNPVETGFRFEPEGMEAATDEERRARYAGEIAANDALVPGFFARLRELGLEEDTLVIFLADHGEFMGERDLWEHRPPGYTPVIRVPLVMFYPRRFGEPRRIAENVQLIDVVPTILDIAGIDRSELLLQGDSLLGLVNGGDDAYWHNRLVVSEEPTAMIKENPCTCGSLLFRNWHVVGSTWIWPGGPLVEWMPTLQSNAKLRAFDFHADPREERILWSFLPDLRLRWLHYKALRDQREIGRSIHERLTADEEAGKQLDPETLEHLRGLGYVN